MKNRNAGRKWKYGSGRNQAGKRTRFENSNRRLRSDRNREELDYRGNRSLPGFTPGSPIDRNFNGPGRSSGWDNEDQYATYDDRSPDEHHYRNDSESEDYRDSYGRDYQKQGSEHNWGEHSTQRVHHGEKNKLSNRGKGPKGYQRSDERIQENINEVLSDDHLLDASDIEVTVDHGEVTIMGTVFSKEDKRRAEDLIEAISGVSNVENRIRVSKRDHTKKESTDSSPGEPDSNGKMKTRKNQVHA